MKKKQPELNAVNLKKSLWETLQAVKAKKIDAAEANAVASAAREIMRVVRTEIDIARLTGTVPSGVLGHDTVKRLR